MSDISTVSTRDSILGSIKKLLGGWDEETAFDDDLIIHINSQFSVLRQLGIGPIGGFAITGDSETWADFLGENEARFNLAKSYVYLRVKEVFDPPTNTTVLKAIQDRGSEYEWRMLFDAETGGT